MFILLSNKLNKENKVGKERGYDPSNSRASTASLWSGKIDTFFWISAHLCSCTHSVCINGTACTNNARGIRPTSVSVQESRNNLGILIVPALGHLLAASWEEATLLKHCRFPNLHQNNHLEKEKCFQVANPVLALQKKNSFLFHLCLCAWQETFMAKYKSFWKCRHSLRVECQSQYLSMHPKCRCS